jgi:dienelactone hydrolase
MSYFALLLILVTFGAQARPSAELLASLPETAAAQVTTSAPVVRGTAREVEMRWTYNNLAAKALLITPANAKKPVPLVVYAHSEGTVLHPRAFVDEAVALAAAGIASLHLSLPLEGLAQANAKDGAALGTSVRLAEQAIAWARAQKSVSDEKIAIVGHRYGAMVAAIVAASDAKVDGLALLAPPGKPSGWLQVSDRPAAQKLRESYPKEAWGEYLFGLAKFDTELWLPHAAHAKTLFQFATQDDWTTTMEQVDLYRAAKGTKERLQYETDSKLNADARRERMDWLRKVLR